MGSRRRVDCARFQQAQLSQLYIKRQLAEHNMNTIRGVFFLCLIITAAANPLDSSLRKGCRGFCPAIYDPVCGSNGMTYSNECAMITQTCNRRPPVTVVRRGHC